jgi:NitT/TauT family transport system substrate-binding protein
MNGWSINDFSKIYTNDLIADINNFDPESIRAQARSYS